MENNNKLLGNKGEFIAGEYIIKNGYKILYKNFRLKHYEIDIIAKQNDGTIVFFEVKTIFSALFNKNQLMPEDNMNYWKINKIIKASKIFILKHPHLINEDKGWRIDLVAVTIGDGNEKNEEEVKVDHYE